MIETFYQAYIDNLILNSFHCFSNKLYNFISNFTYISNFFFFLFLFIIIIFFYIIIIYNPSLHVSPLHPQGIYMYILCVCV